VVEIDRGNQRWGGTVVWRLIFELFAITFFVGDRSFADAAGGF
jgi:hypothetical protein